MGPNWNRLTTETKIATRGSMPLANQQAKNLNAKDNVVHVDFRAHRKAAPVESIPFALAA